jgi:hypothetical protein
MSDTKNIILNSLEYYDKNSETYNKLLSKAKYYKQKKRYGDMQHHTIFFYDKNKKEIFKSNYELIGLYNHFSKLWSWAWSIPWLRKNEAYLSRKILNYGLDTVPEEGSMYMRTELITSRFRISNPIQLDLHVSMASYLSKMPLVYGLYWHPKRSKPDKDGFFEIFQHDEYGEDSGYQIFYMYLLGYKDLELE